MTTSRRRKEAVVARMAAIVGMVLLAAGPAAAGIAEPEPNDTSPQNISGGGLLEDSAPNGLVVVNGELADGDVDLFSFGVRKDVPVTVALFEQALGELDDPEIVLFDGAGNEIARNDDAGPGFFSRLALVPGENDTWSVAVTRFPTGPTLPGQFPKGSSGAAFSYALVVAAQGGLAVQDSDPADSVGSNDLGNPQSLPAGGGVVSGRLVPGDSDVFSFQAAEGELLVASVFDASGGARNDAVLRLHRAGGPAIAENDDGGPGFLPNLARKIEAGEGNAWSIEVAGFEKNPPAPSDERFEYQLVVATASASATPRRCDVNADGSVDRTDVNAIFAARNTLASGPDDLRDDDGNGTITVLDARACTLTCDLPACALPPAPSPLCGLLGPEAMLALLPLAGRFGRRRLTGAGHSWHRGDSDPAEERAA